MATPDPTKILRVSGTLVKSPTDFSAAYPYGGTVLGSINRFMFDFGFEYFKNHAQENARTEKIFLFQRDARASFMLREFSADGISGLFPSASGINVTSPGVYARGWKSLPLHSSGSRIDRAPTPVYCSTTRFP